MKIIKSWRKTISLQFKNGEILIKAPIFILRSQIDDFIEKNKDWIDEQTIIYNSRKKISLDEISTMKDDAKKYIIPRTIYLAQLHGFKYNNIKITSAKTRWGSCTNRKNINFSFYLIKAPKKVIDYVIIHELSHLREMNHSKQFWSIVSEIMPDYKTHINWLKKNGNKLIF